MEYITCTDAEYAQYCKEDTNRQLLKGYRQAIAHLKEVQDCIDGQAGKLVPMWLGFPAYRVLMDTKRGIKAYENELTLRGYDLITLKKKKHV